MNIHVTVELSDIAFRIKEIRTMSKYVTDEIIKNDLLRIATDLESSLDRLTAEIEGH
jgi:hypothetical protein